MNKGERVLEMEKDVNLLEMKRESWAKPKRRESPMFICNFIHTVTRLLQ